MWTPASKRVVSPMENQLEESLISFLQQSIKGSNTEELRQAMAIDLLEEIWQENPNNLTIKDAVNIVQKQVLEKEGEFYGRK